MYENAVSMGKRNHCLMPKKPTTTEITKERKQSP
jgi:hypothetical protein